MYLFSNFFLILSLFLPCYATMLAFVFGLTLSLSEGKCTMLRQTQNELLSKDRYTQRKIWGCQSGASYTFGIVEDLQPLVVDDVRVSRCR